MVRAPLSSAPLGDLLATLEPGRLTVLTGAGVSTESGVPDFRSPGSAWKRYPPIGFAAFQADPAMRTEAWRRKFAMDDVYADAKPGRVHRGLATLARRGVLGTVITQNIDGLHQAGGLSPDRLIELHGNGTYARCLSCHSRFELRDIRLRFERTDEAPTCGCSGPIKSATIAFGQKIDAAIVAAAVAATRACDVFLVLGSSLTVRPAAILPQLAVQAGARLIIANREATPLDAMADAVIRGDVGDLFDQPG